VRNRDPVQAHAWRVRGVFGQLTEILMASSWGRDFADHSPLSVDPLDLDLVFAYPVPDRIDALRYFLTQSDFLGDANPSWIRLW
jgi:hypothetical protein